MASIKEGTNVGGVANQEYPPDETPPMHILNLPSDILFGIFDRLDDNKATRWRHDADLKTIQSLRLVCSTFNRHASPLLCPFLTVRLNQASLDLVDNISRNPFIAAGVRHINVELQYRPKELADDFLRYKNQRQKDLRDWSSDCLWEIEHDYHGIEHDEDDETASEDYLGMLDEDDETVSEISLSMYWRILRRGHEEYRRKHDEQFRLVMDGSFVDTLASAISRMGYGISLNFKDDTDLDSDLNRNLDPTLLSSDLEKLSRLIASPLNWHTIAAIKGGVELLPAKILIELPIAIHKAGATTFIMEFHCLSHIDNYLTVSPGLPNNPVWSDLRAACQHLKEFQLQHGALQTHYQNPPEKQGPMYDCLSAILSGQNIEAVRLCSGPFYHSDHGGREDHDLYRMGTILATANWPRIKDIWITNILLLHGELEAFCRGLDGCRMESVYFRDIELLGEGWAVVLDILHERVSSRCLDGKCKVYFADLEGGEFGRKMKWRDIHGYPMISDDESAAQSYVSGVGPLNPFTNRGRKK